jgi:hypothetical protein
MVLGFMNLFKKGLLAREETKRLENERFYQRSKELKDTLDAAAADFTKSWCKCKPHYIAPILVIHNAWRDYCKTKGLRETLEEYYSDENGYYRLFGNVSFGEGVYQYPRALPLNSGAFGEPPDLIPETPFFYIGIRLQCGVELKALLDKTVQNYIVAYADDLRHATFLMYCKEKGVEDALDEYYNEDKAYYKTFGFIRSFETAIENNKCD